MPCTCPFFGFYPWTRQANHSCKPEGLNSLQTQIANTNQHASSDSIKLAKWLRGTQQRFALAATSSRDLLKLAQHLRQKLGKCCWSALAAVCAFGELPSVQRRGSLDGIFLALVLAGGVNAATHFSKADSSSVVTADFPSQKEDIAVIVS